jgi:phosphinothricin acetyltransferase
MAEIPRVEGVAIRNATKRDITAILSVYAPYVTDTVVSFEDRVPSVDEMETRMEESHVWVVAEEGEALIGFAYAAPFHRRGAYRWSVEVSVYLESGVRGRGIGRALVTHVLERVRASGFVNAFAGTTLPNEASVGLFESIGFTKIAHQREVGYKLGHWHDVGWWQLRLREPEVPPPTLPGG